MNEPITVTAGEGTTFGPKFDMEALRREDGVFPTCIIVGVRGIDSVFRPLRILLPHQLYLETFKELETQGAREVWVLPVFGTFSEAWTQVKLPKWNAERPVTGATGRSGRTPLSEKRTATH